MRGERMASGAAVLIAVAGMAGAGKSRLAARIVERIHALKSDVSGELEEYPDVVAYADAVSRAREVLTAGGSIVLVCPFHTRESRRSLLRLASETRSALLYVECSANESVRRRRLRNRAMSGADPLTRAETDLWVNKLVGEDSKFERVGTEIPRAAQMLVDTTVGVDIWGGLAASRVETWIAGTVPAEAPAAAAIETQAISAG